MANTLILKNSSRPNAAPAVADLQRGELAVNIHDAALFTKDDTDAIVRLNGGLQVVGHIEADIAANGNVTTHNILGGMTINRTAAGQFSLDMTGNIQDGDVVNVRVMGDRLNWYETVGNQNTVTIEVRDSEFIANALKDPEKIIVTVAR
jgi:hypothetical protein